MDEADHFRELLQNFEEQDLVQVNPVAVDLADQEFARDVARRLTALSDERRQHGHVLIQMARIAAWATQRSNPGGRQLVSAIDYLVASRSIQTHCMRARISGGKFDVTVHTVDEETEEKHLLIIEVKTHSELLNTAETIDQIERYMLDLPGVRAHSLVLASHETAIVYNANDAGTELQREKTEFNLRGVRELTQFECNALNVQQDGMAEGINPNRPYQGHAIRPGAEQHARIHTEDRDRPEEIIKNECQQLARAERAANRAANRGGNRGGNRRRNRGGRREPRTQ